MKFKFSDPKEWVSLSLYPHSLIASFTSFLLLLLMKQEEKQHMDRNMEKKAG